MWWCNWNIYFRYLFPYIFFSRVHDVVRWQKWVNIMDFALFGKFTTVWLENPWPIHKKMTCGTKTTILAAAFWVTQPALHARVVGKQQHLSCEKSSDHELFSQGANPSSVPWSLNYEYCISSDINDGYRKCPFPADGWNQELYTSRSCRSSCLSDPSFWGLYLGFYSE